jgi:hypothetical protein
MQTDLVLRTDNVTKRVDLQCEKTLSPPLGDGRGLLVHSVSTATLYCEVRILALCNDASIKISHDGVGHLYHTKNNLLYTAYFYLRKLTRQTRV